MSKRAIGNWKKLRILLILLKVCNGSPKDRVKKLNSRLFVEDEKKGSSCSEWVALYTIDPTNFFKMTWDLCIGLVYLICYFLDPFVLAFKYTPLFIETNRINQLQRALTFILFFNMAIVPFSAIKKKQYIFSDYDSEAATDNK